MQIVIQADNFTLTNDLEDYVKLHLGFDDSGQYDQVEHVLVKLSEVNDEKGNKRNNCFVEVVLEGIPTHIDVQNTEDDMHYAIDLAAKRARKTALLWLRRYGAKSA
tara:strand:+ start:54161 stop:54478 length:318 start_codon:yes stop_codon:yes gene_type:complete